MWARRPKIFTKGRGVGIMIVASLAAGSLAATAPQATDSALRWIQTQFSSGPATAAPPGGSPDVRFAAAAPIVDPVGFQLPGAQPAGTQPGPHIIPNFARELKGERKKLSKIPRPPVQVPVNVDGCDRNYGNAGQCIPAALPPGYRDYCQYLVGHGFKQVKVRGFDRKGLDRERNGIACG